VLDTTTARNALRRSEARNLITFFSDVRDSPGIRYLNKGMILIL